MASSVLRARLPRTLLDALNEAGKAWGRPLTEHDKPIRWALVR